MIIKINGQDETVEKKLNLAELVASKNLPVEKIVVEHNLHIVPKEKWADIFLYENDSIEIVSFVAGG